MDASPTTRHTALSRYLVLAGIAPKNLIALLGPPLDLSSAPVKDGPTPSSQPSAPVDGVVSSSNLDWARCNHHATGDSPWWGVDLGSSKTVTKVKLYNRNDA